MYRPFNRKSADDDNKLESIFLRNPKDLFEERVIWKNNQYSIHYISINSVKLGQDINNLYFIPPEILTFNLVNRFCANKPFDRKELLTFLFAAQPQYLSIETINAQIFCGNIILYIAVYQPFKKCIFFAWKIIAKKWERNITK